MDPLHPDLARAIDDGLTVLAPNRRTAHAWRQGYAERALGAGRIAWTTPDILTLSAWAERTWLQSRSPEAELQLLSAGQTAALWDRVVNDSPLAGWLLNPASAARAAARSWNLVQAYGIPLSAIEAEPGEETQAFVVWARRFEQLCQEQRWLAPARVIPALLDRVTLLPARLQLALAEAPTPLVARLLRRISEQGGEVRAEPRVLAAGQMQVLGATDSDHELRLAAQWSRERLERGCRSVGIVINDLATRRDEVRRVFEEAFVPAARRTGERLPEAPFALESSGPLAEFPLVRAALDMLQVVQGSADSLVVGRVLRSPFFQGFAAEAATRALADAVLRGAAMEHCDIQTLERLAGANACPLLVTRLSAMQPLLPRREEPQPLSHWAERFLQLLAAAGWPGDRALSSAELQTLAKFHDALGGFGSLEDLVGRVGFGSALGHLRQWLSAAAFEPQSLPTPVRIVDPDTVTGMRFDALWIMGCDATRLPPAPDPDPFLPLRLQRQAGIPGTAADSRERAVRELALLRASADLIVCSWSRSRDDTEQPVSPLLQDCTPLAHALAPAQPLAEWLQQQRPALEVFSDEQAPAVPSGHIRGGARVVELQSLCPFRAQAELRLGARPLEVVSPGINARERGTLLHQALELLWNEVRTQERLRAIAPDELRRRVVALLDRCSVPLLKGASPQRARLLRIEVDLAARKVCDLLLLELKRPPFAVLEKPEYATTYAAGGIEIDLALDRIDVLEGSDAGCEVVIDYKTGNSADPRKWWGARPEQPQLPLYAVARRERLAAVAFAQLNAREARFHGVARSADLLPSVRAYNGDAGEWQRLLEQWRQTVDELIDGFARGVASVDPLPGVCGRCHLSSLCRVHELRQQPHDASEPT